MALADLSTKKFTTEEFNRVLKENLEKKRKKSEPTKSVDDESDWETISDDEDDWETIEEPAAKSEEFPEPEPSKTIFDKYNEAWFNQPLTTAPSRAGKAISKWIDPEQGTSGLRSYASAFAESVGDVLSSITAPINVAAMGTGGGAALANKLAPVIAKKFGTTAATQIPKYLGKATSALSYPEIASGAHQVITKDTIPEQLAGAAQALFGAAGVKEGRRFSRPGATPDLSVSLEAPPPDPLAGAIDLPLNEPQPLHTGPTRLDDADVPPPPPTPPTNRLANSTPEELDQLLYDQNPAVQEEAAREIIRRESLTTPPKAAAKPIKELPLPPEIPEPVPVKTEAVTKALSKARKGRPQGKINLSGIAKNFVSDEKGELDLSKIFQGEEDLGYNVRTNDPDAIDVGDVSRPIDLEQEALRAGEETAKPISPIKQFLADESGEIRFGKKGDKEPDFNEIQDNLRAIDEWNPPKGYVDEVFSSFGEGQPGLEIKNSYGRSDDLSGGFDVVYRGPDGKPVAAAKVFGGRAGLKVQDFASDKSKGLLHGRAVKAVLDTLADNNVTRGHGAISGDMSKLIDKARSIRTQAKKFLKDESGEFDPNFYNRAGSQEFSPDLVKQADEVFGGESPRFIERPGQIPEQAPTFSERLLNTLADETGAVPRKPKAADVWANLPDRVKSVFQQNGITPKDIEGMTLKDVNDTYDAVVNQMGGVEPEVDFAGEAQIQPPNLIKKTGERVQPLDEEAQIERLTADAMKAVEREQRIRRAGGEVEMTPEQLASFRRRMQEGEQFAEEVPPQDIFSEPVGLPQPQDRSGIPLLRSKNYLKDLMKSEKGELNLEGLFGEAEPNPNPIPLLPGREDLPPNMPVTDRPAPKPQTQSMFSQVINAPKGMMSVDLPFMTSAAFRQAKPLAWTSEWFKAWDKAARSYGSEEAFQTIMKDIHNSKYFKPRYKPTYNTKGEITGYKEVPSIAEEIGVHLSEGKFVPREEQLGSQLAEKLPGAWGKMIRSSNRAYAAFLNHLRKTKTEELLDQLKWSGNENDKVVAKALGEFVMDATGRGSLKWAGPGGRQADLERIAPVLKNTMWSPRLFAANTKFLNPFTYTSLPDPVRRQYIGGALRMSATWLSFAGLAKMAGAEVNLDPTNSDFGKIKIGDTRVDPAGGMQQLLVFLAREAPKKVGEELGFPTGRFTSSASGNVREYGEGAFPVDRVSVAEDFATSKLAPIQRLAYDLMRSSERRPVHLGDRAVQMAMPIMAQDIMDAMKEDPSLERLIGTSLGSSVGLGVNTYGKGERFGDPVFTNSIEPFLGMQPESLRGTVKQW